MTDQHTADTEYDQQYMPHGIGEYHHVPQADIPATVVKLSDPSPRQHRAWPLTARLAVAVLIIALATVTAMALVTIHSVSARQSRTDTRVSELSQALGLNASQTSQNGGSVSTLNGSVTSLRGQLATLQGRIRAIATAVGHHGLCVSFSRNTGNGDLVDVNLTTPVVSAESVTCGQGTFVSVVPAP